MNQVNLDNIFWSDPQQVEFERYGEFLDTRDKASFEMDTEEVKAFIKVLQFKPFKYFSIFLFYE